MAVNRYSDTIYSTSQLVKIVLPVTSLPDAFIYPNPVTDGTFRLYFDNHRQGKYEVQLVDLTGRVVNSQVVNIGAKAQVEEMIVNSSLARGMYMVKVVDGKRKALFADKILVQ